MDQCFFPRNPATHTFFHFLNVLKLGCPILLANCFKENSICFRLFRALPSAPPGSDELLLSYSTLYSSYEISGNGGKSAIHATSVLHGSTASGNRFVGRHMGGLPHVPGSWSGEAEAEDISRMTGSFPGVT